MSLVILGQGSPDSNATGLIKGGGGSDTGAHAGRMPRAKWSSAATNQEATRSRERGPARILPEGLRRERGPADALPTARS